MNLFAFRPIRARLGTLTLAAVVVGLAGCASSGSNRAPVEDRKPQPRVVSAAPAAASAVPAAGAELRPLPGAENAGKPGYHTVKAGESLIRIALENGQNWRDVQRWNALDNPNLIEVGQVLRVVPPGSDAGVSTRPITSAKAETRPLDAKPAPVAASAAPTTSSPSTSLPAAATTAAAAGREGDDDINWIWPASGPISSVFEEGKSKGLGIAGKLGDPVLAAAEGRVVYAGSGLRGYGNLVILKHNATYLTAYAHNQTLLVKEDQSVRRGQKIAEMGSTDSDRVLLHFEIRRQGKPVDPARLLPPR